MELRPDHPRDNQYPRDPKAVPIGPALVAAGALLLGVLAVVLMLAYAVAHTNRGRHEAGCDPIAVISGPIVTPTTYGYPGPMGGPAR
jgi:hypothetical protein